MVCAFTRSNEDLPEEIPDVVQTDVPLFRSLHFSAPELESPKQESMTISGFSRRNFNSMQVVMTLCDVASGEHKMEQPICCDCGDILHDIMDRKIKQAKDDCDYYKKYLMMSRNDLLTPNLPDLERQLAEAEAEEKALSSQLESLKRDESALLNAIKSEEDERDRLTAQKNEFYSRVNKGQRLLHSVEDEQESVSNLTRHVEFRLAKFKKTNVFDAAFHIWYSNQFGTINNFRMGRLKSTMVTWSEINSGWGQISLLATALIKKLNVDLGDYKIVPYGSHSYIEVVNTGAFSLNLNCDRFQASWFSGQKYPLFGLGGRRYIWDADLDVAMVTFLKCLEQLKVEFGERGVHLPYRMSDGNIQDPMTKSIYSIKTQYGSEEQWTKALKFMLTNLRWCMQHVSLSLEREEEEFWLRYEKNFNTGQALL